MLEKIYAPLTYKFIKYYRDKYIMPPLDNNTYFSDAIGDHEKAATLISKAINEDAPCMISRFGSNELDATLNYKKDILSLSSELFILFGSAIPQKKECLQMQVFSKTTTNHFHILQI